MAIPVETKVERLREQAARAIAAKKSSKVVLPILERLLAATTAGTEAQVYAHRQLAEHLVEHNPWRSLVHGRAALAQGGAKVAEDEGIHALAGLAHALLGNYPSAVAAYRRAVALTPHNPWYQHNLGHLLDVGLARPAEARRHLEAAHRAAGPDDGEISASLAHCLARLGELEAALSHVDVALETGPNKPEHVRLREWILRGAPEEKPATETNDEERAVEPAELAEVGHEVVPTEAGAAWEVRWAIDDPRSEAVLAVLREHMAGEPRLLQRAEQLWTDYARIVGAPLLDRTSVAVWAAMVDLATRDRRTPDKTSPGEPRGRLQVSVAGTARRYGVRADQLRARWVELLEAWIIEGGRWAKLSRAVDHRSPEKRAKD